MAPGGSRTRAGIADALATIIPAPNARAMRPPAAVLRTALCGHTFNPARASTDPGPAAAAALAWASNHCLPLTALGDPQVTRRALEALALRLDGTRAAATTITRKRAVIHGCLRGRTRAFGSQPLDRITWRPPRSFCSAGPRSAATSAEVQAILGEVTQIRLGMTAFFGCLAPAELRVHRRWAAGPGCARRPGQRKPLRPDLAPGPRRGHPGPCRHPAGARAPPP
jgi:hypothetical protein